MSKRQLQDEEKYKKERTKRKKRLKGMLKKNFKKQHTEKRN